MPTDAKEHGGTQQNFSGSCVGCSLVSPIVQGGGPRCRGGQEHVGLPAIVVLYSVMAGSGSHAAA